MKYFILFRSINPLKIINCENKSFTKHFFSRLDFRLLFLIRKMSKNLNLKIFILQVLINKLNFYFF